MSLLMRFRLGWFLKAKTRDDSFRYAAKSGCSLAGKCKSSFLNRG